MDYTSNASIINANLNFLVHVCNFFTFFPPKSAEPAYQGEYYILGTDYLTYAIEVACRDVRGGSRSESKLSSLHLIN